MSRIIKKVVVEYPSEISQYLNSSYDTIRFGSTCCLKYASHRWDVDTIKKTVEQIYNAGKVAEFQTFIAPHSKEHINYIDNSVETLKSFSEEYMPLLVLSDIGFINIKYPKKCASHFLKIQNRDDSALLASFGVSGVEIAPASRSNTEDIMSFSSGVREYGLKVGIAIGKPPVFHGWKCYLCNLSNKEKCNMECESTAIPIYSQSEVKASFYARGKTIYPEAKQKEDLEKLSPDYTISYV